MLIRADITSFQSLKGLIITLNPSFPYRLTNLFQSLKGLIITLLLLYVMYKSPSFQSLKGLIITTTSINDYQLINIISIPQRSDYNYMDMPEYLMFILFQSLKGLIITVLPAIGINMGALFQSLKGLIIT